MVRCLAAALPLWIAVAISITAAAAPPPVPVRLCHIPVQYIATDRLWARHALFAARHLAPRFPALNVSFDYATADGV